MRDPNFLKDHSPPLFTVYIYIMTGCLENEDRRPKTKDLEKEDPLENEDLEKEDPLENEDLEKEDPLENEDLENEDPLENEDLEKEDPLENEDLEKEVNYEGAERKTSGCCIVRA